MYPQWVTQGVVTALQDGVAALEAIYNANAIDPASAAAFTLSVATGPSVSATTPAPTATVTGLYAALVAVHGIIPSLVSDVTGIDPSLGANFIALAEGIGAAMDPAQAAAAFAAALDATYPYAGDGTSPAALAGPQSATTTGLIAPPPPTPNRQAYVDNAEITRRFARGVYLAPYVEALVSQTYATRAQAITARADCAFRFERELELCGWATDIGWATALTAMRDRALAYLSQAIVNSQPVLTVTTPMSLPALFLAWRLYQDPTRASELLAENDVPTAEFMPTTFEALAA